MSIQQNINQIWSLSALLATQSPQIQALGKKQQEISSIKTNIQTYKEDIPARVKALSKALPNEMSQDEADAAVKAGKEFLKAGAPTSEDYGRLAELQPTEENVKNYMQSKAAEAREKARQSLMRKQEEIRAVRDPNYAYTPQGERIAKASDRIRKEQK